MLLELGPKCPFFFLRNFSLTIDNPGPLDLDLSKLSSEEVIRVYNSLNLNHVQSTNREEIDNKVKQLAKEAAAKAPAQPAVQQKKLSLGEMMEVRKEELKKLLEGNVASVKNKVAPMSLADLNRLLDLEKAGKNRSVIVDFITKLQVKEREVITAKMQAINSIPSENERNDSFMDTRLDNISDVVESIDSNPITIEVPKSS